MLLCEEFPSYKTIIKLLSIAHHCPILNSYNLKVKLKFTKSDNKASTALRIK